MAIPVNSELVLIGVRKPKKMLGVANYDSVKHNVCFRHCEEQKFTRNVFPKKNTFFRKPPPLRSSSSVSAERAIPSNRPPIETLERRRRADSQRHRRLHPALHSLVSK